MKRLMLPLSIVALLLTGCKGTQESPPAMPVSSGHGIFLTHCVSCHQGTGNPPGPNGVIMDSGKLASENTFRDFLRQPTTGMMPPFTPEQLPDGDVHELYVYIQSLHTSQPAAAKKGE